MALNCPQCPQIIVKKIVKPPVLYVLFVTQYKRTQLLTSKYLIIKNA